METKNLLKSLKRRLSGMLCLVMFLAISQGAYSWGFKDGGSSWSCEQGFSNQTFYKTPGGSTISLDVKIKATSGGINVTQNDGCNGHTLYVGWSNGSSTDVVRATARWNGGLYSEYTVVIPKGKVYVTPYGGSKIEMTNNGSYAYTAKVSFPSTKTFTISGDAPTGVTIENQSSMPSAGKPSSVQLNYTGLSSSYSTAKIDYNLWTNQLTVTEVVTRTFAANEYIYLKNFKPDGFSDNWVVSSGYAGIKLTMFDGTTQYAWFELYSGTAGAADAVYRAKITTAGECESFVITRNGSNSGDPTTSPWNKTSDCKFTSTSKTYNRITKVTQNSSTWSGDVFTPCTTPTASDFSLSDNEKTYTGSAQKPTFSNAGDGTITHYYYSNDSGSTWTEYANGPTNAGTYKVKVDVSAGTNYCAATDIVLTQTFTINKKTPTASDFSLSNNEKTYTGSALKPTFSNAGDGTISKYYYSNDSGSTWTEYANGPTNAGTYNVKVDVAAGTNYSAKTGIVLTDEFTINKASQSTLTISNSTKNVCNGSNLTLTTSGGSGTGAVTYDIVSGGTGAGTISSSTFTGTSAGTVLIKATKAADANYKEASSTNATFTVNPLNNVSNITFSPSSVKKGETTDATATVTTVGGTGTWSTTTPSLISFTSTSANPTIITANGIGTARVTYTLTNGCNDTSKGAVNSKTVDLVINSDCDAPNAGTISGTTAICAGGSVSLSVTGYTSTNTTLQWNKNGSPVAGKTSNTYTESNVTENATYTVTVTRTDVDNCSATTPTGYEVTVTQIPTITAQGGERCGNGEVTLQATASPVGCTVNWYDAATGGTKQGTGLGKEVNVTVGTPITLYAEAVTTGAVACKSANRASATATAKLVPTIASVTKTDDACGAGDIKFTANGVTASSEVEWFENSVSVGTGGSKTFSGVPAGTSHTVTAKATLDGCESAETTPVTGTRKAVPSLTVTAPIAAYGWENATFTVTGDGTITGSVTQTAGSGGIINDKTFKGHVNDTFRASYTATGDNGCITQQSAEATVVKATESCD